MSIRFALTSALIIMMLPLTSLTAGIYKWTDSSGKVHYSDQAPINEKSEALDPSTALPDKTEDARKKLDQREAKFQKDREERLKKEKAAKDHKEKEKQREQQCMQMRKNLQTYLTKNRVSHVVDGKQVVIGYEERLKKMEALQKQMEKVCDGF